MTERTHVLLRAGFRHDEIATASLIVKRIQKERMETLRSQSWDRFHVFVESAKETVSGAFGYSSSPKPPQRRPVVFTAKTA
jgi:hypothetical protein